VSSVSEQLSFAAARALGVRVGNIIAQANLMKRCPVLSGMHVHRKKNTLIKLKHVREFG